MLNMAKPTILKHFTLGKANIFWYLGVKSNKHMQEPTILSGNVSNAINNHPYLDGMQHP